MGPQTVRGREKFYCNDLGGNDLNNMTSTKISIYLFLVSVFFSSGPVSVFSDETNADTLSATPSSTLSTAPVSPNSTTFNDSGEIDESNSVSGSESISEVTVQKKGISKKTSGKMIHGPNTTGTKALDRFKADSAIRSQYHHEGRRLDVDPD